MLTEYGYSTIGAVAIFCLILFAAAIFINKRPLKYLLAVPGIMLLCFTLYFFRDPERQSPKNENWLLSPADGRVLLIKNVYEKDFLKSEAVQISIFMSPLSVHVNRIPITGTVRFLKYIPGDFLTASNDKADKRNERNMIGLESPKYGKVLYTQVAGFMARRIVCRLNEGQWVQSGERFGMIKFGSRVDVIAPLGWKPAVHQGQAVSAGLTPLFVHR